MLVVMGFLILQDGHLSFAEELSVCGDGAIEGEEQCDDGNLVNGDSCSNLCTTEACGNGYIDASEQCDDGNTMHGDGCSESCTIEFCSDGVVQRGLGEQCDDGNADNDDGCSSDCHREAKDVDPVLETNTEILTNETEKIDTLHPAPLMTAPTREVRIEKSVRTALSQEAGILGKELMSQNMGDLLGHLTQAERDMLSKIFGILAKGLQLSRADRHEAGVLAETLNGALMNERTKHTDLLMAFIQSPMSQTFLKEIGIDPTKLTGEIPTSIQELLLTKEHSTPPAIREGILRDTLSLERLGLPRSSILSEDILEGLQSEKAIERLQALKALKDRTEASSTTDIDGSIESLALSTAAIDESIPLIVRTHQLTASQEAELRRAVGDLSATVQAKDIEVVAEKVITLTTILRRWDVLKKKESSNHPAAPEAPRLGEGVTAVSTTLPENVTMAFSHGSEREQALELIDFLSSNERIRTLRTSLQADGIMAMEERYRDVISNLQHIGQGAATPSTCDDSMPQALQCVSLYMTDLEKAARSQSTFRSVVGSLQDYFGIGHE